MRDYSSWPFELFVALLTIAPIVILIYFYSQLPAQIPVFLGWRGEVAVWAPKSFASVFRIPAMGLDLQLICLLMKYGTVKSQTSYAVGTGDDQAIRLMTKLWDWLRGLAAFKTAAGSLEVVIGLERLRFLFTLAWLLTWLAAILSVVAAAYYTFRLWKVKRGKKSSEEPFKTAARDHLIGGLLYFNRNDPALFTKTYLFNFANKWVYLLIAGIVAYPLLVFIPG